MPLRTTIEKREGEATRNRDAVARRPERVSGLQNGERAHDRHLLPKGDSAIVLVVAHGDEPEPLDARRLDVLAADLGIAHLLCEHNQSRRRLLLPTPPLVIDGLGKRPPRTRNVLPLILGLGAEIGFTRREPLHVPCDDDHIAGQREQKHHTQDREKNPPPHVLNLHRPCRASRRWGRTDAPSPSGSSGILDYDGYGTSTKSNIPCREPWTPGASPEHPEPGLAMPFPAHRRSWPPTPDEAAGSHVAAHRSRRAIRQLSGSPSAPHPEMRPLASADTQGRPPMPPPEAFLYN